MNSRLWICLTSKHFNRKQNASPRRYINKIFTTLYNSIIFLLFLLLHINAMANCLFSNREFIVTFHNVNMPFLDYIPRKKYIHSPDNSVSFISLLTWESIKIFFFKQHSFIKKQINIQFFLHEYFFITYAFESWFHLALFFSS